MSGPLRAAPGQSGGLQAERTALSWDRTVLGVLVNGVLLSLHHASAVRPVWIFASLCAVLVAGMCVHARRGRTAAMRGLAGGGARVAPGSRAVLVVGVAVATLCAMVGVLIVSEAFAAPN